MKLAFTCVVFALCSSSVTAAIAAVTTAAVAAADVCANDEWSYLCNKDSWAGAADAVTGGKELQTAGLRRAMDHIAAETDCATTDTECIEAKSIVDAQKLQIPSVINSHQLKQVAETAGVVHPAASGMFWMTDKTSVSGVNGGDIFTLANYATTFPVGTPVQFGTAVSGIALDTTYYIVAGADANKFTLTQTVGSGVTHEISADIAAIFMYKLSKHTEAYYMGESIEIKGNAFSTSGSDYIDEISLIKFVDASSTNACDGDAHDDIKSSAHIAVASGTFTGCSVDKYDGQGRKACQQGSGTYTSAKLWLAAFAYINTRAKSSATTHSDIAKTRTDSCGTAKDQCGANRAINNDVADPSLTTYRLCMTSPSISENKVFADTGLTIKARCGTSADNSYDANTEFALATALLGASPADDGKYFRCQCKANYERSSTTGMCTACGQSEDKTRTFTSVVGDGVLGFDTATGLPKASGACEMCMAGYTGTEYETTSNNFASNVADNTGAAAALYSMTCAAGVPRKYKCAKCPKGTFRTAVGGVHDQDCARCGAGKYVKQDAAVGATCEADVCVEECGANTAGNAVWGYTGAQTATVGTIADQMPRCVLKCPADKPNHDPQSKTCVALCPWPTVAMDLADPNGSDGDTIKVCQPMTCAADEYVKLPAAADLTYTKTGNVFKALITKHALSGGSVPLPGVTCTAGDTAGMTSTDGTTGTVLTLVANTATAPCTVSHITFTASANTLAVGSVLRFTHAVLEAEGQNKITDVVEAAAAANEHATNSGALYTGFSYTLTAADFVPICTKCAGGETIAAGAFTFPLGEPKPSPLKYVSEVGHGTTYLTKDQAPTAGQAAVINGGNEIVVTANAKNAAWITHTNTPTVNFAADAFKAYATICTALSCTNDDQYVHDHTCHNCPTGKYNRQVTPTADFSTKIFSKRNIADTNPADSICLAQTCQNGQYLIPIDVTAGATTGLIASGSGTGGVCAACPNGKTNTFGEFTNYDATKSKMKTTGVKATNIVDTLLAHTFKDGAMVQYTLSEDLGLGVYKNLPSSFTGCTIAANTEAAGNLVTTTSSVAGGTAVTMKLKADATTANVITQYKFIAGSKMQVGDEVRISMATLNLDANIANCPQDGFTYTIRASDFDHLQTGTNTNVVSGSIFFVRLVPLQTDEFQLEDSEGNLVNLVTGSGKNAKFAHVAATTDLVAPGGPFAGGMNSGHANICRNVLCTEHEFSDQDGTCTACPVGKTSFGATDDAHAEHSDAVCVNTAVCGANEKVVNGVCTACEAGATNAAGDLTEAVNTDCDATKCHQKLAIASTVALDTPWDGCAMASDGLTATISISTAAEQAAGGAIVTETSTNGARSAQFQLTKDDSMEQFSSIKWIAGSGYAVGDQIFVSRAKLESLTDVSACTDVGFTHTIRASDLGVFQQVTNNACVDCPAGKKVATADDGALATGLDTTCVDIATCAVDQYTTGNTCTNCPAGLARPAGMSTTSTADEVATAVCTPWICPVNHQLVNNECTPCQTGLQRWVTTGADTKTTSGAVVANELIFAAAHNLAAGTPVFYKQAAAEAVVPELCNMKDNAKAIAAECADAGVTDTCAAGNQAAAKGTAAKGMDQSDANECNTIYYVLAGTATNKMKLSRTSGGAFMTLTGGAANNVIQPVRGPTTKKVGPTSDEANNDCEPTVCAKQDASLGGNCVSCPTGTYNKADNIGTVAAGRNQFYTTWVSGSTVSTNAVYSGLNALNGAAGGLSAITGITKAAEAVVTVTTMTNAYTVGQRIYISGVQGMAQINGKVCVAKAPLSDTSFTCDNIDSTGFSDYVSGGAGKLHLASLAANFDSGGSAAAADHTCWWQPCTAARTTPSLTAATKTAAAVAANVYAKGDGTCQLCNAGRKRVGARAIGKTGAKGAVITGITQAAGGAVVTYTGVGGVTSTAFAAGDVVYFNSVVGMTEINGLCCTVAAGSLSATTFTCSGGTAGAPCGPLDSSAFSAYGSGGIVSTTWGGAHASHGGAATLGYEAANDNAVLEANACESEGPCAAATLAYGPSTTFLSIAKGAETAITMTAIPIAYAAGATVYLSGISSSGNVDLQNALNGKACNVKAGATTTGFTCDNLNTNALTGNWNSGGVATPKYQASATGAHKGQYADLGTHAQTCTDCPVGKYIVTDSTRGVTKALTTTVATNNPGIAGCVSVACGAHFWPKPNGECDACAAGKFRYGSCPDPASVPNTCTFAPGTTVTQETGIADPCIDTCPLNHRLHNGKCVACAAGKVRKAGDAICTGAPCDALRGVPNAGTPGLNGVAADTQCRNIICGKDHYKDGFRCHKCEAGKTRAQGDDASVAGTTACTQVTCTKDQYVVQSTVNARTVLTCTNCPAGYTMNQVLDATLANVGKLCTVAVCQADYYVKSNKCLKCPANLGNAAGDDPRGADTSCTTVKRCAVNQQVVRSTGVLVTGAVAAGTDNVAMTATPFVANDAVRYYANNVAGITELTDGKVYWVKAKAADSFTLSASCTVDTSIKNGGCLAGGLLALTDASGAAGNLFYKAAEEPYKCEACPAGKSKALDANGLGLARTAIAGCDAIICPANFHVVNHVCVACPAGEVNAAGDNAFTDKYTTCDHDTSQDAFHVDSTLRCAVNFMVRNHVCVACPANTFCPAGANVNGPDTYCTAQSPQPIVHSTAAAPLAATATTNNGDDSFLVPSTTLAVNDPIYYWATPPGSATLAGITGLTEGKIYYVQDKPHATKIKLSLTAGGNAITIDADSGAANNVFIPVSLNGVVNDLCPVNYHVWDHKCKPCAQYYVNAAGDDLHHQNTACTRDLCAVNQRVTSTHTCEACVGDMKAVAGAWKGGAETFCH